MTMEVFGIQPEAISQLIYLVVHKVILLILVLLPAHIFIRILNSFLGRFFARTEFDQTLEKFVHKTSITLMWLIVLGIALVVLGVDVSAVVASFGVGSFIIGFALKDTLNNLAAGVMVLVNHPFQVGDDIKVKDVRGRVKSISMSYTKLETEDRVKVTIPNSIVWSNPIENFTAYIK